MWKDLTEYCASHLQDVGGEDETLPPSTEAFLERLDLPSLHPFCRKFDNSIPFSKFQDSSGPLLQGSVHGPNEFWEAFTTFCYMQLPPFLAFASLWVRLVAGFWAPAGVAVLFLKQLYKQDLDPNGPSRDRCSSRTSAPPATGTDTKSSRLSWWTLGTLASCFILMTDSMYVYEYGGSSHGLGLLVAALVLSSLRRWLPTRSLWGIPPATTFTRHVVLKHNARSWMVLLAVSIAAVGVAVRQDQSSMITHSLWWPANFILDDDTEIHVSSGLYASKQNPFVQHIVQRWPLKHRTYSNPTPWIMNGDIRTGLPFFLNAAPSPKWTRVFLTVRDDIEINETVNTEEVLALDICFPPIGGHNPSQPIYLVLHGANGGSQEEYVKDFAWRVTREQNATVVVMVSRGLMDLPLQSLNFYEAGRWTDVHQTALKLQQAKLNRHQIVAGVGYSMGAIVLANYAVSAGTNVALDAAFLISGSLECRYQQNYSRSQHVWQPMIAHHVKVQQHLLKWGERMRQDGKWTKDDMVQLLRSTNMVSLDNYTSVIQYGHPTLTHFFAYISATGDVSLDDLTRRHETGAGTAAVFPQHAKIHSLAIPMCVLHAFDDPISTWRNNFGNPGHLLHPETLVATGQGNLMLLLTDRGGHVGWPETWFPWKHGWRFMNNAASSFVEAVAEAKREMRNLTTN